jgi:hypothetical protein
MGVKIIDRPTMVLGIGEVDHQILIQPTPQLIDGLIRLESGSSAIGRLTAKGIWGSELSGMFIANGFSRGGFRCFSEDQDVPPIEECIASYLKVDFDPECQELFVSPYPHGELVALNGVALWVRQTSTETVK